MPLPPLRQSVRSLLRSPGFSLTATITLALGIGLSTAVFTVAETLLIRKLPVGEQDRLAVLWAQKGDDPFKFPFGVDDGREFARRSTSLDGAAFFSYGGAVPKPIREGDRVYHLRRAFVSGNFFDVLRSSAILGRTLRADDDVAGAALVVVLSHRAWRQQFGGDSAVLGRSLVMHGDGRAFIVVGVMPQGLDFPRGTDFWAPLIPAAAGAESLNVTSPTLHAVGRMRRGATLADAQADLTSFFTRAEAAEFQRGLHGVATSLPTLLLGDTKSALIIFAAAAGLLLLLTCINVATLLLVRGLSRMREIAVRSALGAGRRRIAGQLLTESAVLAVAGGVLGALLAVAAVKGFVAIAPSGVPRLDEIHVSGTLLLGAVGITAVAMLLFALAPAVMTSRVELQDVLRSGARQIGGGRGMRMATEGLVVGQIALAVVVLIAAGLMTRSLIKLQGVDLALEPKNVLIAELAIRHSAFDANATQTALLEPLLARVAGIPGVEAVSPALTAPYAPLGYGIEGTFSRPDQTPDQAAQNPMVFFEVIAPNYFSTLGIPVVAGRRFSSDDRQGTPLVVIVSESVAQHFWPGANPLSKTLGSATQPFTVVGVVPDTRYRDLRTARASVYFPLQQSQFPVVPLTLVIRTSAPPAAVIPALRSAIAEVNPGVALATAAPFETLLAEPRARPRLNAVLLGIFATTALMLAAIGLFGVIATMVRQRARELGIRMALGATQTAVRQMVIVRGLSLAAAGAIIGIAGGLLMNRWLSDLLFQVSPTDGATLGIVAVLMLGVAAVSSFIPAQWSTRIDPAIAMRSEG